MLRVIRKQSPLLIACLLIAAPRTVLACSVCMGRSDDASTQGLNAAVLTLLSALLVVLVGVVSSIAVLVRRAIEHPMARPHTSGGVVQ